MGSLTQGVQRKAPKQSDHGIERGDLSGTQFPREPKGRPAHRAA